MAEKRQNDTESKRKMRISFEVHGWDGDLENFGKKIRYTIDVRINGKRQDIIFIPEDGSVPEIMEYHNEGYPPGILSGSVIDNIFKKYNFEAMYKKAYGIE